MRIAITAVFAVFVAGGQSADRGESQLAFIRGDDASYHAWVMRSDGRGQHRLPIRNLPVQSPDGKWVAWWTGVRTYSRLMVARSDWHGTREIARANNRPCYDPKWSPDSRRISYVVGCEGDRTSAFVVDRDGSRRRELRAGKWNRGGGWSPDGRKLLLLSASPHKPWRFYIVDAETFAMRVVPRFHPHISLLRWTWARDGRTVFVESVGSGWGSWRLDTKTGRAKDLSRKLQARWVSLSPNGQWIVYQATPGTSDDWEIVVSHPDGSGFRQLTNNRKVQDEMPQWSPDGSRIAFARSVVPYGRSQVYVMNADGSQQRNVSNSRTNDASPVWVRGL